MVINYKNEKRVECYRDFVMNPSDRCASRKFSKMFGAKLMGPAKKLHERLIAFETAGAYNAKYGTTDNRIELKLGTPDRNPLILKVRIGRGPRKFFHNQIGDGEDFLLKKDWDGDFNSVSTIYVIEINNHDYNLE